MSTHLYKPKIVCMYSPKDHMNVHSAFIPNN